MRQLALALIRAYQRLLSPLLGPTCRFYPSCSSYSATAIERFGLRRGGWLAIKRILHCHPWHAGGIDEVPASLEIHAGCTHAADPKHHSPGL